MKKIRLIIPYFGKLPTFFPYFLLTAKRNQKIDFLIYTDQKVDQFEILNAKNIEFVTLSFDDLREKIQMSYLVIFINFWKSIAFLRMIMLDMAFLVTSKYLKIHKKLIVYLCLVKV